MQGNLELLTASKKDDEDDGLLGSDNTQLEEGVVDGPKYEYNEKDFKKGRVTMFDIFNNKK